MKDVRGVDIHVGAKVIYFKTGRYPEMIEATVLEMKKKVRVGKFVGLSRTSRYTDESLWAEPTSLVVTADFPKPVETVSAFVTLPETSRVEMDVLYPSKPGEGSTEYSNRVLGHAREHGTNRQCSIGWHDECSERAFGEVAECNCLCHAEGAEIYSVEGHAEDGVVTVIRAERGKHRWPPQDDEPETMWAWWVLARSETEAAVQGATLERNRLA